MRNWTTIRQEISFVLAGKKDRVKTRQALGISKSTWNQWLAIAIHKGVDCLGDHRGGDHHRKLTSSQR